MTNNNLTDERLSVLIRVARDSLELYEMELPVIDDVMLALAELQQLRAAMLQAGNSPVSPDGYVLVPKKLTAENGAKGVLSGEFSETKFRVEFYSQYHRRNHPQQNVDQR